MRSPSLREKADYEARLDALLDRVSALQAELYICKQLSEPDPIELEIQGRSLTVCVEALTAANGRLAALQSMAKACARVGAPIQPWEALLIIDGSWTP